MEDILQSFNWLDIAIVVPIVIAIAKGAWRGLIMEAASFIGLFLGVIGGILFMDQIKTLLDNFLEMSETGLTILAFIIIFVTIILGVSLVAKLADYIFEVAQLSWLNRLGGAAFGFVSSFLIVGLLILLLNRVDSSFQIIPEKTKRESVFYAPISVIIPKILDVLGLEEIEELLHPKTLTDELI
jgi:membrane protein required for colicin V production